MAKILDLRKKVRPQVKIIYKTVVERQPWYIEIGKVLAVIAIVSVIVWGTSKADSANIKPKVSNFSASGIVSDISSTTLSLINAHGTDSASNTSYILDLGNVKRVEDKDHNILSISDIALNYEVVAQGTLTDGIINIHRIISFGLLDIATSTASTTDTIATSTATTTLDLASSTPEISSSTDNTSSTTSDNTATTTDITTDTTSTTTDDTLSTTTSDIASSTDNTSSTTSDTTATTTDITTDTTSTTTATTTDTALDDSSSTATTTN